MKKTLLFVYGTLRKGEANHHFVQHANIRAEQCWTKGELYDTTFGYPVMKKGIEKIYGELYEVNDQQLESINGLEGYKEDGKTNLYERVSQTVYTDKGEFEALLYIAGESLSQCETKIKLGDWKVYQFEKEQNDFLYLAYGSCLDDERFIKAGVHDYFANVVGVGKVKGYSLRFSLPTTDGGKADIVEEGGVVEGKVYKIPWQGLQYLYEREGVNISLYRPAIIEVDIANKQYENVLTFFVVEKKKETPPSPLYATEILRGGKNVLSDSYMKGVENHIRNLS
ncbi:gamma-glutamylcyclotransferase family protein [Alkalihalobacillus sp. LMS39]|uniref:gamma-glutamylcyclotransferase n=1 Tax=Alkalihalobacillus sp. LMS39 TaxID=2924032 RepID=UPI001FB2AD0B|nr:gamma-glutamylcyclotransferase family protein [Alkalihalobacillus sp. LMS39]UOE96253.1 gamma-glutamylcyclotransferase [Alkalihalobacillus sp. LMS39]